jgi:hypothetical protein
MRKRFCFNGLLLISILSVAGFISCTKYAPPEPSYAEIFIDSITDIQMNSALIHGFNAIEDDFSIEQKGIIWSSQRFYTGKPKDEPTYELMGTGDYNIGAVIDSSNSNTFSIKLTELVKDKVNLVRGYVKYNDVYYYGPSFSFVTPTQ